MSDGDAGAAAELALVGSPFFFREATPDTRILAGEHRPLETFPPDVAYEADRLGGVSLVSGGACVSYWEEQLRIFRCAPSAVYPFHRVASSCLWELGTARVPGELIAPWCVSI